LKNVKTHHDFLLAMGMSPDEIKQYSYKSVSPKKNRKTKDNNE
jgi:hypothetical protein